MAFFPKHAHEDLNKHLQLLALAIIEEDKEKAKKVLEEARRAEASQKFQIKIVWIILLLFVALVVFVEWDKILALFN